MKRPSKNFEISCNESHMDYLFQRHYSNLKMMQIYFCGSIRGGRQDQELYFRIINQLRSYGEVLTEHIGAKDIEKSTYFLFLVETGWKNPA